MEESAKNTKAREMQEKTRECRRLQEDAIDHRETQGKCKTTAGRHRETQGESSKV